jgi:hypothetical protein
VVGKIATRRSKRWTGRWACALSLAISGVIVSRARTAIAHPLHTTLAELSYDPSAGVLNVSLRVFADDFSAGVMPRSRASAHALPPDSAMLRYVRERFAVTVDGAGRLAWRWCGRRREGQVLFLCLRATARESPVGARMRNALLSEVFTDQVNIVHANYAGRRRTLLFTARDGVKALP